MTLSIRPLQNERAPILGRIPLRSLAFRPFLFALLAFLLTAPGEVAHLGPEGCCQNHDFRYTYLNGEVGILPRLWGSFVLTYLYGLEGPTDHLEKNVGFSDAWFGRKYQVLEGRTPVSLAATLRTGTSTTRTARRLETARNGAAS